MAAALTHLSFFRSADNLVRFGIDPPVKADNVLHWPRLLACLSDTKRTRAADFARLNNRNLSYFIGIDARESVPQSILSGDRNIAGGLLTSNGILQFDRNSHVGWGSDIHKDSGNVVLGDGSAMQTTPSSVQKLIQAALLTQTNPPAIRLAIPR